MATIGSLVVNLIAKTEVFDRELRKSIQTIRQFKNEVTANQQALLGIAKTGAAITAAYIGVKSAAYAIRSITTAALEAQKAENEYAAAIGGTAEIRRQATEAAKQFAAQMQKQTIYGDELIMSQMAYAKNLGVTTDRLQDAARAAIGLAARYRLDLSTAMMLIGRASQGQTQMLTRYGIVLDDALTAQQKFAAVLKIGAGSFGLAEEQTKTAAGTIAQFKNEWSDAREEFGKAFLPELTSELRNFTKYLQENKEEIREAGREMAAFVATAVKGIRYVADTAKELGVTKLSAGFGLAGYKVGGPLGGLIGLEVGAGVDLAIDKYVDSYIAKNTMKLRRPANLEDIEIVTNTVRKVGTTAQQAAPQVEELTKEVDKLVKSLQTELLGVGTSRLAAELDKITGATVQQRAQVTSLVNQIEASKAIETLRGMVKERTETIATFGMGEIEKQRYAVAQLFDQIFRIKDLDPMYLKEFTEQAQKLFALFETNKTMMDAADALKKIKDEAREAKYEMEGFAKSTREQMQTPWQKYAEQNLKINQAVREGYLSNTEGVTALGLAKEQLGGRIDTLNRQLEQEIATVRLSSEQRERAIALTNMQAAAEETFGKNTRLAALAVEGYVQRYDQLLQVKKEMAELERRRELRESIAGKFTLLEQERQLYGLGRSKDLEIRREWARDLLEIKKAAQELYGGNQEAVNAITDAWLAAQKLNQQLRDIERISDQMGDAGARAFEDWILGAKSASEAVKDLYMEVIRLSLRQMATEPMSRAISAGASSVFAGLLGIKTSARGNIFINGDIVPFASGGVFDSPAYFPMRGGKTGLLGENGPEAILPLMRGPGGKLGVKAEGGGDVINNYNYNMTVQTPNADSFRRSSSQIKAALMTKR